MQKFTKQGRVMLRRPVCTFAILSLALLTLSNQAFADALNIRYSPLVSVTGDEEDVSDFFLAVETIPTLLQM